MPKISVCIPVYGVEQYIERCAISLFKQTLDDIEFIFIDDCTPDRSIERLKCVIEKYRLRLAEMNDVVRIERMPTNSGLAAVRRYVMQLVTGDYIIHCDSDDWVDKDLYRTMYEEAVKADADMVVSDYVVTDGQGHNQRREGCSSTERDTFIVNMLFQRDSWSLCNKLIKKSVYYKANVAFPTGAMGEDLTTVLQLVWYCGKIYYVNRSCYYYFQNPQSITRKKSAQEAKKNYCQLTDNAAILQKFYKDKKVSKDIQAGLDWIWIRIGDVLSPYLYDKEFFQLWREHYKAYLKKIVCNKHISFAYKIKHIILRSGLYSRFKR